MARFLFVAGTDTGVGKTHASVSLLRAAQRRGHRSIGIKPVSAGCERVDGELVNGDALQLQAAAGVSLAYAEVNPVALEPPIAPHIAADEVGRALQAKELVEHCRVVASRARADLAVVEGAGGWLVPLNAAESLADVARGLAAGVVLVVGMKLGCLNHALLTAGRIRDDGLELVGWVANQIDPDMERAQENVASLEARLQAPRLGVVPHLGPVAAQDAFDRALDWTALWT